MYEGIPLQYEIKFVINKTNKYAWNHKYQSFLRVPPEKRILLVGVHQIPCFNGLNDKALFPRKQKPCYHHWLITHEHSRNEVESKFGTAK